MLEALHSVRPFGGGTTLFLSIAAGITIGGLAAALGQGTRIIRAMPNTPAAIGMGITALVGGSEAAESDMIVAESLMSAVGETVRLNHESQIDAVTAVSGSGPAYVFHLIEALVEAAEQEGLPKETALRLAKATVAGAGCLALESGDGPARLRENCHVAGRDDCGGFDGSHGRRGRISAIAEKGGQGRGRPGKGARIRIWLKSASRIS